MTRVLVSVRDLDEARQALEAGVDLIDLKEPSQGALGRVPAAVAAAAVDYVYARSNGRIPVSLALGELYNLPEPAAAWSNFPANATYGKLGLAGCASDESYNWRERWGAFARGAPRDVFPVAVCYADWKTCGAPPPVEVLIESRMHDCRAMLVDTFDKTRGSLFDVWPAEDLKAFCRNVRRAGLVLVLGGSLNQQSLTAAIALKPDYVAFRGAACAGRRDGRLDEARLAALMNAVREGARALSAQGA